MKNIKTPKVTPGGNHQGGEPQKKEYVEKITRQPVQTVEGRKDKGKTDVGGDTGQTDELRFNDLLPKVLMRIKALGPTAQKSCENNLTYVNNKAKTYAQRLSVLTTLDDWTTKQIKAVEERKRKEEQERQEKEKERQRLEEDQKLRERYKHLHTTVMNSLKLLGEGALKQSEQNLDYINNETKPLATRVQQLETLSGWSQKQLKLREEKKSEEERRLRQGEVNKLAVEVEQALNTEPKLPTTRHQEFQSRLGKAKESLDLAGLKDLLGQVKLATQEEANRLHRQNQTKEPTNTPPPKQPNQPPQSRPNTPPKQPTKPTNTPTVGTTGKKINVPTQEVGLLKQSVAKLKQTNAVSESERKTLESLLDRRPALARGVVRLLEKSPVVPQEKLEEARRLFEAAQKEAGLADAKLKEELLREQNAKQNENEETRERMLKIIGPQLEKARETQKKAAEKLKEAEKTFRELEKSNATRTHLLKALKSGPLARPGGDGLDDETAVALIGKFEEYPEAAGEALALAPRVKNPGALVKGVDTLGKLGASGFGGPVRGRRLDPGEVSLMTRRALETGGTLGGDYFQRMETYYSKAENRDKPDPFEVPLTGGKLFATDTERATRITGVIGQSAFREDGTFEPGKFQSSVDDLCFHPDMLRSQSSWSVLAEQVETTRGQFADERGEFRKTLNGVGKPTDPNARALVGRTLGLDPKAQPTVGQTKASILTAMMTPFAQGSVGSCFSTAPCLKYRTEQPLDFLKDLTTMTTRGVLEKGRDKIPPVLNIAPGENTLLRSWEYSVAQLGSRRTNSKEKTQLTTSLFGGYTDQLGEGKTSIKDLLEQGTEKGWPKKRASIEQKIRESYTFAYNPKAERSDASDGSSDRGAFELVRVKDNKVVASKEEFLKDLKELLLDTLGRDRETQTAIEKHLDDKFVKGLMAGYSGGKGSPWELPGGGQSEDTVELLTGVPQVDDKDRGTLLDGKTEPKEGTKAQALLGNLLSAFSGKTDQCVTFSVEGVHAMNALPNHPSLAPLKGRNPIEVGKKMKEHLLDPGKTLSETRLDPERLAFFHERVLGSLPDDYKDELKSGPVGEMTPGKFKEHVLGQLRKKAEQKAVEEVRRKPPKTEKPNPTEKELKELAEAKRKELTETNLKSLGDTIDNLLLNEMGGPEFVLIDTNWGGPNSHDFMVVRPDPSTGQPALWQKTDPPGTYKRVKDDWMGKEWKYPKAKTESN